MTLLTYLSVMYMEASLLACFPPFRQLRLAIPFSERRRHFVNVLHTPTCPHVSSPTPKLDM